MAPGRSRKTVPKTGQATRSVSQSLRNSNDTLIPRNEGLQSNLPNSEANGTSPLGNEVQQESPLLNSISGNSPNNETPIATETNGGGNTRKRGRGIARGFQVKNRLKEGNKIGGVIINKDLNLPVGPSDKTFKMEIGILTRMLAPITAFYWKNVTEEQKIPIMERLQNEFDIDLKDSHTKMVVDHVMGTRFSNYKHTCHKHYKKFSSPEEAQANPPTYLDSSDWIALCEHFESEQFKAQSMANTENRTHLEVPHASGGKSYCQRMYEMEMEHATNEDVEESQDGNKDEPIEMKLYFDTHHKKDGTWTHPKAQENYEQMKAIFAQVVEDGIEMSGREILEKVLKPKSNYSRGLGHGVKPKNKVSELQSLLHDERIQAEKQVSELSKRIETQDEQISSQKKTIEELTQSHEELKTLVQSLVQQRA